MSNLMHEHPLVDALRRLNAEIDEMVLITITPADTGEVYNHEGITVKWLEGKNRDLFGNRIDAVMLIPGRGSISFCANDHADLQACIDEYLAQNPIER